MKFGRLNNNSYLLRLEKGEEVIETISSFCKKYSIHNGSFMGLGSIENITLAHYLLDTKQYSEKQILGIFEVINMIGTVGLYEQKPLVHIHISLSDQEMRTLGGHLVKTTVSATLEVVLTVYPSLFNKMHNETIGLKLFDLPEST